MKRINNLKRLKRMTACMLVFLTLGSTMAIDTNAEELLSISEIETLSYETDNTEEFTEAVNEISALDTMVLTVISDKTLTDYYGAEKSIHNGNVYKLYYNNVRTAKSAKKKFENAGYTVNYERSESEITLVSEETADTVAILDKLSEATEKTYGTEKEGSAATVDGIQKITKNKVVVAVIDNQIDYNDEYLKNRLVKSTEVTKTDGTKEKQFVIIPEGAFDEEFQKNTHATLIAKTITSQTDENILIAPFNVADNEGNIKLSSVISAIYEAIDMNVDIINISLNAKGTSNLLEKAVNDASDKGIQVVVSAGNNEGDTKDYVPSNISSAVVVSSVKDKKIASSSNMGNTVDFSADGVVSYKTGIVNKKGEDIINQTEGTSIASAKVSAYIALILSEHAKGFVRPVLEKAAIDLGDAGFDKVYGNGYLTKNNVIEVLSDDEFLKQLEDKLVKEEQKEHKKENSVITPVSPEKDFLLSESVLYNGEHDSGCYIEAHGGGVSGWSAPGFRYGAEVDRTYTNHYNAGDWIEGDAKGKKVLDKTGSEHTICKNASIDGNTPSWAEVWDGGKFRACQVGITYQLGFGNPSVYGYDFTGWTGGNNPYTSATGYWWTYVDAYAPDHHIYMNWSCNHSGATKEVYYDGNEPSSCGYYECTRCGATWGTWGHNWDSNWSYNDSTHWHYCGWNHNHWKDDASHTYAYWYSTNTENYYKCTVCGRSYSETRTYPVDINCYYMDDNGNWQHECDNFSHVSVSSDNSSWARDLWEYPTWNSNYTVYASADDGWEIVGWSDVVSGDDQFKPFDSNATSYTGYMDSGTASNDCYEIINVFVRKKTYLDLNAYYYHNGKTYGGLSGYDADFGKCDLYINGNLYASGIADVYQQFPAGTTYEFKNFRMNDGFGFSDTGNLKGTIVNTLGSSSTVQAVPNIYNKQVFAYYSGGNATSGSDFYKIYDLVNTKGKYKINSDNAFSKTGFGIVGYKSNSNNFYNKDDEVKASDMPCSDNTSGSAKIRASTGNVLEVQWASNDSGANIWLYNAYSGFADSEEWSFRDAGDGYYYIINTYRGKAVDVTDGIAADFTNVRLCNFNGSDAQKWKFTPTGEGSYYIETKLVDSNGTHYRLDWEGVGTATSSVIIYHSKDYHCQKWKIEFENRDSIFEAQWGKEYEVRFHANDADIPSGEVTANENTSYSYNSTQKYFTTKIYDVSAYNAEATANGGEKSKVNYLPGVNELFSSNHYIPVGDDVTSKFFVQNSSKKYQWWTNGLSENIGKGTKSYNNLVSLAKNNNGIADVYAKWMPRTYTIELSTESYKDSLYDVDINNFIEENVNIYEINKQNGSYYIYEVYNDCYGYKDSNGNYKEFFKVNGKFATGFNLKATGYVFEGFYYNHQDSLCNKLTLVKRRNGINRYFFTDENGVILNQKPNMGVSFTLHPSFRPIEYTVKLHSNVPGNTKSQLEVLINENSDFTYNEAGKYFSRTLTYNKTQDLLSPVGIYKLKGYHLSGDYDWYRDVAGKTLAATAVNNGNLWAEDRWNLTTTDNDTVDLYADWTANSYTIHYNSNIDFMSANNKTGTTSGSTANSVHTYDEPKALTVNEYHRNGYNFTGWNTKADGSGESFTDGQSVVNLVSEDGGSITLYAQWEARTDTKYTVNYWLEKLYLDGTTTYADSTKHDEINYYIEDSVEYTGTTDTIVEAPLLEYAGFITPNGQTVKILGDGNAVVNYYYTRDIFSVDKKDDSNFKPNKGSEIISGNGIESTNMISLDNSEKRTFKYDEIVTVTAKVKDGYHWHIDDDCYTSKLGLYETKWSEPEKGYGVEKWVDGYGYKDQTTKFYMPAHNVKLRADATNNSYTINFYPNKPSNVINPITGAASTATNEVSPNTVISRQYIYNHAGQVLPTFSLRGWIFEGWSKTITYNNNYGADNRNARYNLLFPYNADNTWSNINALPIMTTKNLDIINLYAKWEATVDEIALNYGHSASTNLHGDLGYREQEEKDTKLTKNGPDKIRLTYDAKMSDSPELKNLNGLPIPTLTGAESTGWVNNKGSICNNETIYTGLENKMLYITWRQLTGTFTYSANGITYNNNGIGASIEKKSGSENINVMTDNITLKDNMFGIKNNGTTYNNYTQGDKYGYTVLKDGKSYTSITDTKNRTAYYSFQGWSANKYATVVGDNNAGLIHQPGYFNRLYRYVYETIAANKLNNKNTGFNLSTAIPDEMRSSVDTMILNKGLGIEADQTNLNAVMYAVWDQFPTISTNVVNIPISVLETYLDKNTYAFNNEVNDKIKEFIKADLEVTDREDGDLKNSLEFDGVDDIIEIITDMYKNPEKTSNTITTRIHVSDSVDNTTYAYVKVVLISNKAKQNEPVIPVAEYDDKLSKISGIRIDSTRIITKKFYNASYENGGLIPNSIWKNNSDYKEAIETCFENFEKNTPEETWLFTHSTIKEFRDNFNPEKTTSSLNEFYEKYKSCKIK